MQPPTKKHVSDDIAAVGEYFTFSLAPWVSGDSVYIDAIRRALRTGEYGILHELKRIGVILKFSYNKNLIPTVGRTVLTRRLTGDTTYSGEVDYGALGTQPNPSFSNSSTQLENEVYRKQAASREFDENIAYIDWFIASSDVADQTFTEFGAFIDGTASADSGQAWSLLATGGWVKSGSIFISARYTFN